MGTFCLTTSSQQETVLKDSVTENAICDVPSQAIFQSWWVWRGLMTVKLHCELPDLLPLGSGELLLGDHWYWWVVCNAAALLGQYFSPESLVPLSSWSIKRTPLLQGAGGLGLVTRT